MNNLYACKINMIGQTGLYKNVDIGCYLPFIPRIGDLLYLEEEACKYFDVIYKKEYWEQVPNLLEKWLKNNMKAPDFSGYVKEVHYYHVNDREEPPFDIYVTPEE